MTFWSAFDDIITLICFALDICYRGYHMPAREYVFYPRASVQLNISRVNAYEEDIKFNFTCVDILFS